MSSREPRILFLRPQILLLSPLHPLQVASSTPILPRLSLPSPPLLPPTLTNPPPLPGVLRGPLVSGLQLRSSTRSLSLSPSPRSTCPLLAGMESPRLSAKSLRRFWSSTKSRLRLQQTKSLVRPLSTSNRTLRRSSRRQRRVSSLCSALSYVFTLPLELMVFNHLCR